MTPERASLIRETWRRYGGWHLFEKHGPVVRLLPALPLHPIAFEGPESMSVDAAITLPPALEFTYSRQTTWEVARPRVHRVHCEGLLVDQHS